MRERTRKGHRQSNQHWNCFKGRERVIVSQINTGTVSKDEKGPSSVRPTLELFQRTRKGHRKSDQHWNCFKGRERAIVSQINTGTVSKDEKGSSSVRPTLELVQRTRKVHRQSDQRWNCFKGRESVSHTNVGTVSKATVGKLFRDGVETTEVCVLNRTQYI